MFEFGPGAPVPRKVDRVVMRRRTSHDGQGGKWSRPGNKSVVPRASPQPAEDGAQDDPFARRMIKEALQRANITVVGEAQNGRQAVDLVLEHDRTP